MHKREILDSWKSWTASNSTKQNDTGFKFEFHQIEQQVLATGNTVSIDNINNRRPTDRDDVSKKRPTEEAFPVITPPPNLRDRTPPPSYKCGDNSSKTSPELSVHDSDMETMHEEENPFVVREVSRNKKVKTILSWRHVIDNININDSSTNDWVKEDHNVSIDFRNFQLDVIKQLEGNQTFSYQIDMERILCLSSIMFCSESKPEYVSCSENVWKQIRPRPLAPTMLPQNVIIIIAEYHTLLDDKQLINTKWCENWSLRNTLQTEEDKDIFDCAQIVTRNFFMYLSSVSFNENKELNEDTFVHRYCHQILEEIFGKTDFALVWANGESESSKERRILDGNNHGKKPDFRVLGKIDDVNREFLFGEIKPPHHSTVINKSVIKLAEFMKGSLDLIINRCGYIFGLEIYGMLICGHEIKIFNMDLAYDGLYRCSLLSKILLPTENANFLNIITVISTLYSLLKRLRSTISAINSSQPSQPQSSSSRQLYSSQPSQSQSSSSHHLYSSQPSQPQSSSSCHLYCRRSNSSPRKIRVPIVGA